MAVQTTTFEKTIRTLLDEKKYQTVKDILVTMEPADIAAVFDDFGEERMALLFRLLPKETAAETFAELESEIQETLIRGFSDRELHELVNEGLHSKLFKMPVEARMKLQETLERVINEGCSGLICLIL